MTKATIPEIIKKIEERTAIDHYAARSPEWASASSHRDGNSGRPWCLRARFSPTGVFATRRWLLSTTPSKRNANDTNRRLSALVGFP